MKGTRTVKNIISKNKKMLEKRYNVKVIGIFGSYARGDIRKKSDVDILVEFSEIPDIFKFIELEGLLSELIGVKVDLVSRKALKPLIKDNILKETIYI